MGFIRKPPRTSLSLLIPKLIQVTLPDFLASVIIYIGIHFQTMLLRATCLILVLWNSLNLKPRVYFLPFQFSPTVYQLANGCTAWAVLLFVHQTLKTAM